MIITRPMELTDAHDVGTGRWRLVETSDEHEHAESLCDCGGRSHDHPTTAGHATPDEATACPVARAKVDARRFGGPVADNAVLSYGSDNAGGVHLYLGDARIHLSGDAAHDLAAGLMAEATRPPSPSVDALAPGATLTVPGTALAPSTAATLAPSGPAPENRERYGRAAFEAYNIAVGGLTWDGKPIPGWDAVTDKVREGWRVAAMAAVDAAVFEGVLP